ITTIEPPPLLPELQHLNMGNNNNNNMPIPPPPPPPPAFPSDPSHHSASSGSGLGVISIAIDEQPGDQHVIEVPPPPDSRTISPPPIMAKSPPPTIVRQGSDHKRGRSDQFKNGIKGFTERLRSTSRGRNNAKNQHEGQTNTPSPYEIRSPEPAADVTIIVCHSFPSSICISLSTQWVANVGYHESTTNFPGIFRVNEEVIVRLKWGQTEYKGRLISVDSYMNIQLSNTEEWIDGKESASLGQVLIRSVGSTAGDLWTRISDLFLWFEDLTRQSANGCGIDVTMCSGYLGRKGREGT
ncbi:MAG: hypothetical protein Q9228_007110, partial [Teloschistes exilis]